MLLIKYRSLNCAWICCKACRKQLKHERLVWGETRDICKCFSPLLVYFLLPKCFTTDQSTVKASLLVL